jgi:hypothetical protein
MLGLGRPSEGNVPEKNSPVPGVTLRQEIQPTPSPELFASAPSAETATVWSKLTNNERLWNTREEENRRKIRLAKADGYRPRLSGVSTQKED